MTRKPQQRPFEERLNGHKLRTVTMQLPEEVAEMIDELSGALDITPSDFIGRAVNIFASEMAKMAMIMPAWMTEEDDDD